MDLTSKYWLVQNLFLGRSLHGFESAIPKSDTFEKPVDFTPHDMLNLGVWVEFCRHVARRRYNLGRSY